MTTIVADTNVIVSAIFWPGESRDCLALWARRRFHLAATPTILAEYREVAARLGRRIPGVNPEPWLRWIEEKARLYEPVLLGKRRSRDPDDDVFLACALACGGKLIVSRDRDLLVLGKPFGIEVLTPRELFNCFR